MKREWQIRELRDLRALKDLMEGTTASRHLAAVGAVTAKWSLFEALIDTASIQLANIPPEIGVGFTAQIAGSARKLDAFISLVRLSKASNQLLKDLIAFARKTKDLVIIRNRIVHDVWVLDASLKPQRLEVTARQVSKIEVVNMSTKDVFAFAERIDRHIARFEILSRMAEVQQKAQPEPLTTG